MTVTPFIIPLTNTNQLVTVTLAGVSYQIRVIWNDINQAWTVDISDNQGNAILTGLAMVTGRDLLEPFGYLDFGGQLIAQTSNDTEAVPTLADLGSTGQLYFVVTD